MKERRSAVLEELDRAKDADRDARLYLVEAAQRMDMKRANTYLVKRSRDASMPMPTRVVFSGRGRPARWLSRVLREGWREGESGIEEILRAVTMWEDARTTVSAAERKALRRWRANLASGGRAHGYSESVRQIAREEAKRLGIVPGAVKRGDLPRLRREVEKRLPDGEELPRVQTLSRWLKIWAASQS